MPGQPRKLLTATFIDGLSRLSMDSRILIAISRLGRSGEFAEPISSADFMVHSIDCGENTYIGKLDRINIKVIVYQIGIDLIVSYVDAENLANEWARNHRVELISEGRVLRVIEIADDMKVVKESEERFIELGQDDRYPSLLAERVRKLINDQAMDT